MQLQLSKWFRNSDCLKMVRFSFVLMPISKAVLKGVFDRNVLIEFTEKLLTFTDYSLSFANCHRGHIGDLTCFPQHLKPGDFAHTNSQQSETISNGLNTKY